MVVSQDIAVGSDDNTRPIGVIDLFLNALLDNKTKKRLIEGRHLRHLGLDMHHAVDGRRRHIGKVGKRQARLTYLVRHPRYILNLRRLCIARLHDKYANCSNKTDNLFHIQKHLYFLFPKQQITLFIVQATKKKSPIPHPSSRPSCLC